MIVCPNCNHQNPEGAVQCEACYTPLPALTQCPNCGASVQSDASFCGQCGFDLRTSNHLSPEAPTAVPAAPAGSASPPLSQPELEIPELVPPEPLVAPESFTVASVSSPTVTPPPIPTGNLSESQSETNGPEKGVAAENFEPSLGVTQIQVNRAKLLHVQTNTLIELPPHLTLVHLGKPNDRVPPTIDVSGFPNSEIVSRIHANIRVEGDIYYIEDVGSSNGTYVNNMPLPLGNRHRLRAGDRVALGKGDKVTFIFQSS